MNVGLPEVFGECLFDQGCPESATFPIMGTGHASVLVCPLVLPSHGKEIVHNNGNEVAIAINTHAIRSHILSNRQTESL